MVVESELVVVGSELEEVVGSVLVEEESELVEVVRKQEEEEMVKSVQPLVSQLLVCEV